MTCLVSNGTRSSRSSTSVSVSPPMFSVVVSILSVSTLPSTMTCPLMPTLTCTALVVLVVLVPKVCRSRLSAPRMMKRFSRTSRSGSRSPSPSTPRVVLTRAPTWHRLMDHRRQMDKPCGWFIFVCSCLLNLLHCFVLLLIYFCFISFWREGLGCNFVSISVLTSFSYGDTVKFAVTG